MANTIPEKTRIEHQGSLNAKRVVLVDAFGGILSQGNMAVMVDESTAGTIYIGLAQIGSATNSAVWQIKKLVEVSSVTTITWADGNDSFDNTWDNRASLSYS